MCRLQTSLLLSANEVACVKRVSSVCQEFCPRGWGRCTSLRQTTQTTPLGTPPPLGRHPLGRHPLDRHPSGQTPLWTDTPPGQTPTSPGQIPPLGRHPPGRHPLGRRPARDGYCSRRTHPTGLHSCCNGVFLNEFSDKRFVITRTSHPVTSCLRGQDARVGVGVTGGGGGCDWSDSLNSLNLMKALVHLRKSLMLPQHRALTLISRCYGDLSLLWGSFVAMGISRCYGDLALLWESWVAMGISRCCGNQIA